jgi:DNA-binding transcriptional LysR family regulator
MDVLRLMSSYAAVVTHGSFTRAGARVGLSKSVVSRHVSALEKHLGVQLLYRSTHNVRATEAGERFYAYCKDLEEVAEQAVAVATAAGEQPRGLLRITLPQTLVVSPVGALLTRFQRKYADVQLDVRVTSLQLDPVEEGFDLALRIGNLKDSSLIARKIRDIRFQTVAAPRYLAKHGVPRSSAELASHNCLVYSEFLSRARDVPERRRRTSEPGGNLATNSGVLLMNAVLAGQGIAVGPDLMFEEYVRRGQLRVILEADAAEKTGLYAVFPAGRFPSASRKAFVDFLIAETNRE